MSNWAISRKTSLFINVGLVVLNTVVVLAHWLNVEEKAAIVSAAGVIKTLIAANAYDLAPSGDKLPPECDTK